MPDTRARSWACTTRRWRRPAATATPSTAGSGSPRSPPRASTSCRLCSPRSSPASGNRLRLEVGTSEQVWDAGRPRGRPGHRGTPAGVAGRCRARDAPNALVVVAAPAIAASFEPGDRGCSGRRARAPGPPARRCWRAGSRPPGSPWARTARSRRRGRRARRHPGLRGRGAGHLADGRLVEVKAPPTPLRRPWHAVTNPHPAAAALLVSHLLDQDEPTARWRVPRARARQA